MNLTIGEEQRRAVDLRTMTEKLIEDRRRDARRTCYELLLLNAVAVVVIVVAILKG